MRRAAALLTASAVVAVVGADASAVRGAQPPALPSSCSDNSPCRLAAGTYRMGFSTVIEGLRLTLPRGWSTTENSGGELKLVPPGLPNEWLFIWLDLVAVKSTGKGVGTILPGVGRTPDKLIGWLTHNPDFAVFPPQPVEPRTRRADDDPGPRRLHLGELRRSGMPVESEMRRLFQESEVLGSVGFLRHRRTGRGTPLPGHGQIRRRFPHTVRRTRRREPRPALAPDRNGPRHHRVDPPTGRRHRRLTRDPHPTQSGLRRVRLAAARRRERGRRVAGIPRRRRPRRSDGHLSTFLASSDTLMRMK